MIRIETIPPAKAETPPPAKGRKPKQGPEPIAAPECAIEADPDVLTVPQIKAARALLSWKQEDLAVASGVSLAGLTNIERGKADPRAKTLVKIQEAFERAGLEIIHKGDGKGEGLRFAKPKGERPAEIVASSVAPPDEKDA